MALVAPSVLSADFANLAAAIHEMEEAGAQILHIDVMDGHFVPNLTIGIPVVESIRRCTKLVLDVHLMISNPEQMADPFIQAGADYLSVHYETVDGQNHLIDLIEAIRDRGAQPGVVLNPATPVSALDRLLGHCYYVLIMSVNPGFSGQKFISNSFEKVRELKELIESRSLDVRVEIDGGMGAHNTEQAVRSGVDIVVAGSAVFNSPSPKEAFRQMQRIAGGVAGQE